jgi:hypothetical protein
VARGIGRMPATSICARCWSSALRAH